MSVISYIDLQCKPSIMAHKKALKFHHSAEAASRSPLYVKLSLSGSRHLGGVRLSFTLHYSSARSAHPNSFPQHSIYPRTKTFPPSLETSPTASVLRPSAFPVPNRFMLRNKTDGFCSSCPAPPPSPLARARSPLARKSSQGRIPNTSETSDP